MSGRADWGSLGKPAGYQADTSRKCTCWGVGQRQAHHLGLPSRGTRKPAPDFGKTDNAPCSDSEASDSHCAFGGFMRPWRSLVSLHPARAHCSPPERRCPGDGLPLLAFVGAPAWARACASSSCACPKPPPPRSCPGHCFGSSPINQPLANFSQLGKNFYSKHSKPAFHRTQLRLTMGRLVGGDHIQS